MSYNYNVLKDLLKVRKKARKEEGALDAVPIQQRQSFSFQLLFVAAMFMLFGATNTFAQTKIIDPTGDGGFENGATFEANGWTPMNDDVDQWYVGNVQSPASGTKGAYISNTNGKSFTYTQVSPMQVSFFYRDVTVPAGENKITLSFKWKNFGKDSDTGDRIVVFVAPTTLTPIASQLPAAAVEITPNFANTAIGLDNNPDYKTDTYYLPKSYAGTTFRLIFAYRVGTFGNAGLMPGAIDDISLVSQVPSLVTSIKSGNWSDSSIWDSGTVPQNENVVIGAGHTVKIDRKGDYLAPFDILTGSASTNNLTVNGTLTFGEVPAPGSPTAKVAAGLQIYGNLLVNSGGNFSMFYNGVVSSKIYTYGTFCVGGDVTNNGYMDIYQSEMILSSSNVQTIGGTGVFANSNTSLPTDSSTFGPTMYVNNVRLRNSNGATPNVVWNFDAKIIALLEMKQARVALGSKVLTLGVSPTAPGNFPCTEDAGFTPGSKFVRFWVNSDFGFTVPTAANTDLFLYGKGKYPFVNAKGENRSVYLQRISVGSAINGEIGMTYNDASTYTTGLNVADGTSTITNRFDGNWTVTDSGTGSSPFRIAIQAPGVLTTANTLANNAVRIMHANDVFGAFLPGNKMPTAIRDNVTMAQLTAGPLYLGAAAADLVPATTVTSVANGNWNNAATWSNNLVPTKDDVVTIADGTTVTVNTAGNVSKNVNIASGGTLLNVSGDLTIGVTLNNNMLINNGTLNVSGGTLYINGSSVHNTRSTFIQSGGDIIVDGNDGTTANSVATTVPMMKIYATTPANLQWTGGTLTFVDPHAGSASLSGGNPEYVLTVTQYGDYNSASRNHTVKFGDGISTTPAGTPEGFRFALKPVDNNSTTAPFRLGSVVVNGNDTYRMVKPLAAGGLTIGFEGDVIVNSGTLSFPNQSTNYCINGKLVNNGTLINQGTIYMGMERAYYNQTGGSNGSGTLTTYFAPCPIAQSIEGTGRFVCTLLTPTPEAAGINTTANLKINNSSASGVTLKVPLTIVNQTSAGTLTLVQGKLNTDNVNLLTLGTPAVDGTIDSNWLGNTDTYVNGPLARYIKTNTSTNYIFFPVGKSKFLPFSIAPTVTVPTTALALIKAEAFETNSGSTDVTCSNLASVRWETTSSVPLSTSNVKMGDANIVSGMIPVQSTSAAGVYTAAFGNTSIFTTTAPNTIATSFPAVATNYFSYGKLATCNGTPVAGTAMANGGGNTVITGVLTGVIVGYGGPIELSLQGAVLYEGQTYQWEGSADNVTYAPINGLNTALAYTKQDDAISYYRCKITCGGTTAVSSFVAVIPVVPTLVWTSTSVCPGASATITPVSTFNTATSYCALYDGPEGSGNLISYNTTSNSFSTGALSATKTFYVAVIDKNTGRISKRVPVTAQVSPVPAAPTAVDQSLCNSVSDAFLTSLTTTSGTPTNWYATATGGTAYNASSTIVTNGTTYYASQIVAGCESTSRTPVVATVIGVPTASTQGFCNGGTVANLVATAPQGGTIKWYSALTNGTQWASTDVLATGTYFVSQTVGGCESRRVQVTVNIGTSTPAAPTTSAATPSYCSTAGSIMSTMVVTGATGSTIKWYDAATGGNFIPSTTAIPTGTNDFYAAQVVGGCESTARLRVTPTVSVVDAPSAAAAQTVCGINPQGPTLLAASAVPTGATATFKLYNVATGGSALTSGSAVNGATYYVSQTINGCEGVTRAAVSVSVTSPSPPIVASSVDVCNVPGATIANLMALTTTQLPGSTQKWYQSSTVKLPGDVLAGTSYSVAEVTAAGCESAQRSNCFVTLGATVPTAPTVIPAGLFTTGETVANLSAVGAVGSTIKWYNASTGGTPLASTTSLTDETSYYSTQTLAGCESPRSLVVATLGVTLPGAPTADAKQTFCLSPKVSDLVAGVQGDIIKWYLFPTGGSPLIASASITGQTTYYASQTVNGAESIQRTPVLVIQNTVTPAPPTATANQSFCNSATVADLTANGSGIKWYTVDKNGTALAPTTALTTGTYYPTQTYVTCETSATTTRNAVNVVVAPAPGIPILVAPQTATPVVCYGATVANLSVTGVAGSTIKWYDAATNGNLLASTTPVVTGTTYFASQMVGSAACGSATRLAVTPTVNGLISAPTVTSVAQTVCTGLPSTASTTSLSATGVTGNTIKWYTSATGSALAPATISNSTYFAADSNAASGCESSVRTPVLVTVVTVGAPIAATPQAVCSSSATVADLVASGSNIKWYSAQTGGTPLAPSTILTAGNYYPTQMNGTCETPSTLQRVAIAVTVTPTVVAPSPAAAQTVCIGTTPATVVNLVPAPSTTQKWYAGQTGGTALVGTDAIANGTYYVTSVTAGCESARIPSVVTIAAKPAAPIIGAITHPTCTVSTGTVALSGLPATGTWTLTPATPAITGTGTSYTVTGVGAGGGRSYTVTDSNGCTATTATFTINSTIAPTTPSVTITQPTCTVNTGSVVFGGTPPNGVGFLNPGNIIYSGGSKTLSGLASGSYSYTYTNANGCTSAALPVVILAAPTTPIVGAVTQPTCTTLGSVVLSGLPATGAWTINPGNITGSGTSATVSNLAAGTYNFTVTNAVCTSPASATVTINAQPVTPVVPVLGTVTQPTCTIATGSFAITNYDATYTYAFTPSTGVVNNAGTVTAPAGTYTVTATLGACTSAVSASATVNAQPATLAQPALGTVTQPTCSVATGSFAITNYDASYTYAFTPSTPSTGVTNTTRNSNCTRAGTYTVTATLGACTSIASASATVNAQPATLAQPILGTVTQPTCTVATGSFAISNYDATYTYAFTPSTGVTNTTGTVTAPAGTYTVTATLGACTSVASANATVNAQPATLAQPTLGTVTQPTCTVATGSFAISNYEATYTYAFTPSAGVSNTAGAVIAPAGTYTVTATLGACTSVASASATVNAQPSTAAPTLGTVTQPTCATATGSFAITNYSASNTYAFTPSTGVINNAGTVTAPAGTYTVIATGACTSAASASATVNAQPATPVKPTFGTVTQPTCSVATGSFVITNYNASYAYAFTPSTGVVNNAGTVTAPAGTYTVIATGACTSVASASATVNAQPATPVQPTLGSVTQPTCGTPVGTFVIANYNASYTYAFTPSAGVTNSAGTVTASAGTYTVTAISGACNSVASVNVVFNAPDVTPAPTGVSPQVFINSAVISDIAVNVLTGGTVQWYPSKSNALLNVNALAANTPLVDGTKYYAVQTVNGCRSTSVLTVTVSITVQSILGVDQFAKVKMDYYPNPVIDILNITHTNVISSIEVFNLLGQRVLTARPNATSTKMDMSDLPVGTYLLEVQAEGKTTTVKVVKNQ